MQKQIYYTCKTCFGSASSSKDRINIDRVKKQLCLSCYVENKYKMELKKYLEQLYYDENLSTDKIAKQLEITQNGVRNYFKQFGIRPKNVNKIRKSYQSIETHLTHLNEGYRAEGIAKKIIIEEKLKIIEEDFQGKYLIDNNLTDRKYDTYDHICKQDEKIVIIDIKNKKYSDDRTKNYFYVTRREIDTFEYYKNKENIIINILVIIKFEHKLLYKFFDWNDFSIPKGFFEGKYNNTVRVKLKENLDLIQFKEKK